MTTAPPDHALRLAALWGAWLLLMLFHVELGLMPLFHGLRVEIETRVHPERVPRLFWAMLVYFVLPLLAMLLAVYGASAPAGWSASPSWRAGQLWLSALYTLTNVVHLVADIRIPDSRGDQVALMAVLCVIGGLINVEAWLWWRA
ncbi:MAG: hypothetical protein VKM98_02955 [Cyanobacteriota bacterium]|nr:hypothetical protein [Cyanobacteriota bacterium]